MDSIICNKCYATVERGRKPFSVTQCGHVYCQECVQEAEKQCFQCQQRGVFSVELGGPSFSKVAEYFDSLPESIERLLKVYSFQNNQKKIVLQRFNSLDNKYEHLKSRYYNMAQNLKKLHQKYNELKVNYEKMQKKLMCLEMHNSARSSTNHMTTPMTSTTQSKFGYTASSHRSNTLTDKSNLITPAESYKMRTRHLKMEGFHIPNTDRIRSDSRFAFDRNPNYNFRD